MHSPDIQRDDRGSSSRNERRTGWANMSLLECLQSIRAFPVKIEEVTTTTLEATVSGILELFSGGVLVYEDVYLLYSKIEQQFPNHHQTTYLCGILNGYSLALSHQVLLASGPLTR